MNTTDDFLYAVYTYDNGNRDNRVFGNYISTNDINETTRKLEKFRESREYARLYPDFAKFANEITGIASDLFIQGKKAVDLIKTIVIANDRGFTPEELAGTELLSSSDNKQYLTAIVGENMEKVSNNEAGWQRLLCNALYADALKSVARMKAEMGNAIKNGEDGKKEAGEIGKAQRKADKLESKFVLAFGTPPQYPEAMTEILRKSSFIPEENSNSGKFVEEGLETWMKRLPSSLKKYADKPEQTEAQLDYIRAEIKRESINNDATIQIADYISAAILASSLTRERVGDSFEKVSKTALPDENIYDIIEYRIEQLQSQEKDIRQKIEVCVDLQEKQSLKEELESIRKNIENGREILNRCEKDRSMFIGIEQSISEGSVDLQAKDIIRAFPSMSGEYFEKYYGYRMDGLDARQLTDSDVIIAETYRDIIRKRIRELEMLCDRGTDESLKPQIKELAAKCTLLMEIDRHLTPCMKIVNTPSQASSITYGLEQNKYVRICYNEKNGTMRMISPKILIDNKAGDWKNVSGIMPVSKAVEIISYHVKDSRMTKTELIPSAKIVSARIDKIMNIDDFGKSDEKNTYIQTVLKAEPEKRPDLSGLSEQFLNEKEKQALILMEEDYDRVTPGYVGSVQTDENREELREYIEKSNGEDVRLQPGKVETEQKDNHEKRGMHM